MLSATPRAVKQGSNDAAPAGEQVQGNAASPNEQVAPQSEPLDGSITEIPESLWSPEVIVNLPAEQPPALLDSFLPYGIALINALLVAYVVHYLTTRRDQRREIVALQKAIVDATHEARDDALARWEAKTQTKRAQLALQTKMDLQRVGSLVKQLEVESAYRRIFGRKEQGISLSERAGKLRDEITTTEFDDKTEGVTDHRRDTVVQQSGLFIAELDAAVVRWMQR